MTEMQIKYMTAIAELPSKEIESKKATDLYNRTWSRELDARKIETDRRFYDALGDRELSRYYGQWWDNNGRGRGSTNHNWWNPKTDTYGVGRRNFNAVAKWSGDMAKTSLENSGKAAAALAKAAI